jgi:hypothetical protein
MVVVDTSVVVVVAVNSHNDRLLIVRCPGEQQVSVEYWRNVNTSPSFTGTDLVPVAVFC